VTLPTNEVTVSKIEAVFGNIGFNLEKTLSIHKQQGFKALQCLCGKVLEMKYEEVYLRDYEMLPEVRDHIARYCPFTRRRSPSVSGLPYTH
jgi:hypothetical protein